LPSNTPGKPKDLDPENEKRWNDSESMSSIETDRMECTDLALSIPVFGVKYCSVVLGVEPENEVWNEYESGS